MFQTKVLEKIKYTLYAQYTFLKVLFKIGQQQPTFCMKTYMHFCVHFEHNVLNTYQKEKCFKQT
jgi:hypothetical protein